MNELANLAAGSTLGGCGSVGGAGKWGARLFLRCFVFGLLKYTFSFFHLASFLCAVFYLAVPVRLACSALYSLAW